MTRRSRDRGVFAVLAVVAILLGLASRRYASALPPFVAAYAGDALWATTAFLILALVFPRSRSWTIAAAAFAIAVLIECSQLYHAPWLDALRATPMGALALGHGFLWTDLVCYAAGVALGLAADDSERRVKAGHL